MDDMNSSSALSYSPEKDRLFSEISRRRESGEPCVIGIDGMCGSGKSTLAELIRETFPGTQIVHMDDFFLPAELRTPERYAEPGGNVHYERIQEEVLGPLSRGERSFSYRRFSCHDMVYVPEPVDIDLSEGGVLVMEGSYSLRPDLRGAYDLAVFTCCDEQTQLDRIEKRSGKDKLQMFIDRWIPLENRYFESFEVRDSADMVIDTSFPLKH